MLIKRVINTQYEKRTDKIYEHDRITGKTEEKVTINPIRYTHDKTGYTRIRFNINASSSMHFCLEMHVLLSS